MRPVQDVDVLTEAGPARRPLVAALIVAAVVIVADQVTKRWAVARLDPGPCRDEADNCIDVVWTLRFRFIENPGAAFSSGESLGPLFGVIAIVMTVVLLNVARKRQDRWGPVLFGLIAGGAVGNLIDRVLRAEDGPLSGTVVDFIDFQWWPVFNVADMAVVTGVVAFIAYTMIDPEAAGGASPAEDGSEGSSDVPGDLDDPASADPASVDPGDAADGGDPAPARADRIGPEGRGDSDTSGSVDAVGPVESDGG